MPLFIPKDWMPWELSSNTLDRIVEMRHTGPARYADRELAKPSIDKIVSILLDCWEQAGQNEHNHAGKLCDPRTYKICYFAALAAQSEQGTGSALARLARKTLGDQRPLEIDPAHVLTLGYLVLQFEEITMLQRKYYPPSTADQSFKASLKRSSLKSPTHNL